MFILIFTFIYSLPSINLQLPAHYTNFTVLRTKNPIKITIAPQNKCQTQVKTLTLGQRCRRVKWFDVQLQQNQNPNTLMFTNKGLMGMTGGQRSSSNKINTPVCRSSWPCLKTKDGEPERSDAAKTAISCVYFSFPSLFFNFWKICCGIEDSPGEEKLKKENGQSDTDQDMQKFWYCWQSYIK